MGQILVGDGQKPTRIQELVMGLHRSDQEENVRRIEAVVAALVSEGIAGQGEAATTTLAAKIREADERVANAQAEADQLRSALTTAAQLAEDQQAHITNLEGRLAEVNKVVDAPPPAPPAPAEPEAPVVP